MVIENFKPGKKYISLVSDDSQYPSLSAGEIVEYLRESPIFPGNYFIDTKSRFIRKSSVQELDQFADYSFLEKALDLYSANQRLAFSPNFNSLLSTNKKKGVMSFLKDIPKNIKKLLNKPTRAMYQLGWIDQNLEITQEGESRLTELCFEKFKEELGAIAVRELAKIKKHESENE